MTYILLFNYHRAKIVQTCQQWGCWPAGSLEAGLKIDCLCVCGVQEAVIEPGTAAYDNWASAEAVVYRQFWLFDVKNPLEVLNYGSKPVVTEKGPYTYR